MADRLDEKLKRLYPEGRSLSTDRGRTARTVLDPSDKEEFKRWKENKKRTDLKGFDTKKSKEPSVMSVVRSIQGGNVAYIADISDSNEAPDKFASDDFQAGKLLAEKKEEIKDLESLKRIVNEQWEQDEGLANLVPVLKDRDYQSLMAHPTIQRYIQNNIKPDLIKFVTKRYKVEPVRATKVLNRLSPDVKQKLWDKVQKGMTPKIKTMTEQRRSKTKAKEKGERAGGDKRYTWSQQEINFLKVNRNLPPEKLQRAYNDVFKTKDRSLASIRRKLNQVRQKYGKR